MTLKHTKALDTIYTDRQLTANSFNGYDARYYTGSFEEARQELAYWIEQGWATAVPTAENTIEITAEEMQVAICRYVLDRTA